MRLSTLKGGVRDLEVPVPGEGEETVKVQYRPGELTLEISDAMLGAASQGVESYAILIFLQKVIVGWDLEDDILDENGDPTGELRPLSTSVEDIKKIPAPFLGQLMLAIQEDARPNLPTDEISSDTSQVEASSDGSLSGTPSFGLQSTTESLPGN